MTISRLSLLHKTWLTLITLAIVFLLTPALNRSQNGWNDWLMRSHLRESSQAPIKIVYFDERDIESLGGWPLPRNIHAYIAEKLCQLGANVVGFDIYWGPRANGVDENDLLLASILARRQNICGSFYFAQIGKDGGSDEIPSLLKWPRAFSSTRLIPAAELQAPATELLQTSGRFGFANLAVDNDGMIRKANLLLRSGNAVYPSFANVLTHNAAAVALDSALDKITINYRLGVKQLPLISVREILQAQDTVLASVFQGSVVLVGVISSQLGFTKPTPVDPNMPVVAIHAQIVDNLISRSYLRPLPRWLWLLVLILLAGFAILWQPKRLWMATVTPLTLTALFVLAAVTLWNFHLVFPLFAAFAGILLFSLPYAIERILSHKQSVANEIAQREALEQKFAEMVAVTSRLQMESEKKRQEHQKEIDRLRSELTLVSPAISALAPEEFPEIICSPASPMAKILTELKRIAATDAPVLITGESGTGKELIAKAIHQKSKRSQHPFIAVNCAALAENLLESELFGHEKGAFTGAYQAKAGLFEAANHGTIFLDEISATTPAFQARLLRVVQEGEYFRVGSTQIRTAEVRIIAASNRSLAQMVEAGAFREDLYFRLNVLPVQLPPLRERTDDIPLLLAHFLLSANCRISEEAVRLLKTHAWPGNIRELQNLAARMRVLGDGAVIDSDWVRKQLNLKATPASAMESLDERILLLYRELQFRNEANTQIAQRLGNLHRSTITEYLKGMTFLFFAEAGFELEGAIRRFNPNPDHHLDGRVKNRMLKYLHNLREELDPRLPVEVNLKKVEERIRKMPQRYHEAALRVARAYLEGRWKPGAE